jgi:hypothetical protein
MEGVDHRVPGSLIACDRQWDFGSEAKIRMKSRTKATQHRHLAGIDERIGSRVGPNADIESDGSPDPRQLVDAHGGEHAPLDPSHL